MKCVASMCRSESKKLKRDAVNEALELVFTATCYVLITQFRMSVERAKRILERIEYYSLIMLDKIGLNKKRAETIIKRILFYANRALRNDAELKKYKELLKQKYDCEINITGR